jgi:hypothetical protein
VLVLGVKPILSRRVLNVRHSAASNTPRRPRFSHSDDELSAAGWLIGDHADGPRSGAWSRTASARRVLRIQFDDLARVERVQPRNRDWRLVVSLSNVMASAWGDRVTRSPAERLLSGPTRPVRFAAGLE